MSKSSDWLAFMAVVLIWSTTPLAIIYSSHEIDPFLSLSARFALSLAVLSVWYLAKKRKLPFHLDAIKTYIAVGVIGIGLSMSCAYMAAQSLPSSLIALIFGLTPLFAGIFEGLVFKSLHLQSIHWLGIIIAFIGLMVVVVNPTQNMQSILTFGAIFMLMATGLHALSASLVKRIKVKLDIWDTVLGGLIFALPFTLVFWLLNGASLPEHISNQTILSIVYLGIIGSLAGFLLYYKTLKAFSATTSSFITLLAPPIALVWAFTINNEPVSWLLLLGTALILTGLFLFIFYTAEKAEPI